MYVRTENYIYPLTLTEIINALDLREGKVVRKPFAKAYDNRQTYQFHCHVCNYALLNNQSL